MQSQTFLVGQSRLPPSLHRSMIENMVELRRQIVPRRRVHLDDEARASLNHAHQEAAAPGDLVQLVTCSQS